jgi:hypothetical protein
MRWMSALMLLAFALVACRPPQQQANGSGLVVTVETERTPRLGTTPLTVRLERDGEPVAGADVRVTGDMTHAGMVPVLRDTVEVEPGVYRAADFEFTMAGDWIITADVTLPGGDRATGELFTGLDGN